MLFSLLQLRPWFIHGIKHRDHRVQRVQQHSNIQRKTAMCECCVSVYTMLIRRRAGVLRTTDLHTIKHIPTYTLNRSHKSIQYTMLLCIISRAQRLRRVYTLNNLHGLHISTAPLSNIQKLTCLWNKQTNQRTNDYINAGRISCGCMDLYT